MRSQPVGRSWPSGQSAGPAEGEVCCFCCWAAAEARERGLAAPPRRAPRSRAASRASLAASDSPPPSLSLPLPLPLPLFSEPLPLLWSSEGEARATIGEAARLSELFRSRGRGRGGRRAAVAIDGDDAVFFVAAAAAAKKGADVEAREQVPVRAEASVRCIPVAVDRRGRAGWRDKGKPCGLLRRILSR